MGSALSGFAQIGMGQLEAGSKAQAASDDAADEQRVLTYNAIQAGEKGRLEEGKLRMAGTQLLAAQKVGYANSGVAVDSGTPLAVMESQAALNELDATTAQNNAARAVWGYKMQREQSKKNKDRKVDASGRDAIGSALSGSGQIIGSSFGGGGGMGGFGGGIPGGG
jgi:hypothetical protein